MNTTSSVTEIIYPGALERQIFSAEDHRELYASEEFTERITSYVAGIVAAKKISLFSFDVFDTALLREPHCELRRFLRSAEQFADLCGKSPRDVLVARLMAAQGAYSASPMAVDGTREGTLAGIARTTCDFIGTPERSDEFVSNELKVERKQLSANPLVQRLIKSFPSLPVIFVSDMYIRSKDIASLLRPFFGKQVRVFSSADGFGSKRNRGLYKHVSTELGVPTGSTLHFGDSLHSDFRQARASGLKSVYLPLPAKEVLRRRECFASIRSSLMETSINVHSYVQFNM